MSSVSYAYTVLSASEEQAELKAQVNKLKRRKKRDKGHSVAATEDEFDGSTDKEQNKKDNEGLLWRALAITTAAVSVGANLFAMFTFGGTFHTITGGIAAAVSTTVATRAVSLEDAESKLG